VSVPHRFAKDQIDHCDARQSGFIAASLAVIPAMRPRRKGNAAPAARRYQTQVIPGHHRRRLVNARRWVQLARAFGIGWRGGAGELPAPRIEDPKDAGVHAFDARLLALPPGVGLWSWRCSTAFIPARPGRH